MFAPTIAAEYQDLLFDPQTSGGLLVAIAPNAAEERSPLSSATVFPPAKLAKWLPSELRFSRSNEIR